MSESTIVAEGLCKRYEDREAVRDLRFAVEPGTVFGLIGTNGAGKSTAIRMLLGLLTPTAGSSRVFGEDSLELSRETRRRIGYLAEDGFEDHGLSTAELLQYVSAFYERWDWDRSRVLCDRLDVDRARPLSAMSVGERRRAELVLTLAPDPDLLVLDDPAVGLDATVRRDFLWGALDAARSEAKTVLFTSHVLHDVERVVDTVGILHDGELRELAPLDELQSRVRRIALPGAGDDVPTLPGELSRTARGGDLVIVTRAFSADLERELRSRGAVDVETMSLEDIFCAIVEHEPEGAR